MAGQLSHMWYVKAADRVWGPYPEGRIAAFVEEGRVGPATPVSPFASGPFAPAAANPEFGPLLRARAEAAARPTPELAAPLAPVEPALPSIPAEFAPEPQARAAPAPLAPAPLPSTPRPAAPLAAGPATPRARPAVAPAPQPEAAAQPQSQPQPQPQPGDGPERRLLVWASLTGEGVRTFPAALAAFGPGVAITSGLWLVRARLSAPALRNLLSRRLGPQDSLLVVEADLERAAWFNVEPVRDRELRRLWASSAQA